MNYLELGIGELEAEKSNLEKLYAKYKAMGLKLDMSRGKPASSQLDLSNGSLETLRTTRSVSGTDARNYGILDGLPEMRAYFGELLGLDPETIVVGGNSSLNLMFDMMAQLMLFGPAGYEPWGRQGRLKWLCPAPGYDRHFAITEKFGFEMIIVPMTPTGPDMNIVESLAKDDPEIKGIWCVPLYSNPQGICYSDETVRRLGAMKTAAPDFRIFWDNAYGVHHIVGEKHLADIFAACKAGGNANRPYYFFSTSKITFPGAGVSIMAMTPEERTWALKRMTIQTIGHDKLNQLRLLQFLPTPADLRNHMKKLAGEIAPKFDLVRKKLSEAFEGTGLLSWQVPEGGYFYAVDTLDGCAKRTVALAADAGVKMTGAGATFPLKHDPRDRNIRIAPTYPPVAELDQAMDLFVICAKLAGVEKLLAEKKN
ncbi:MAG: aminotransferase [Victivallaceae bacterium]|nr:aminotransferase [Victivallaceae bacterium]